MVQGVSSGLRSPILPLANLSCLSIVNQSSPAALYISDGFCQSPGGTPAGRHKPGHLPIFLMSTMEGLWPQKLTEKGRKGPKPQ